MFSLKMIMSTKTGLLDRRRNPFEPSDRPHTCVQVEDLAKSDVERAKATSDRGGQRALDPHQIGGESINRLVGKPGAHRVVRLLPGQNLHPVHLPRASVRLLHGGIEDPDRGGPDVGAGAVTLDEGDDRIVGNGETVRAHGDGCGHDRDLLEETGTEPGTLAERDLLRSGTQTCPVTATFLPSERSERWGRCRRAGGGTCEAEPPASGGTPPYGGRYRQPATGRRTGRPASVWPRL